MDFQFNDSSPWKNAVLKETKQKISRGNVSCWKNIFKVLSQAHNSEVEIKKVV
jgi:hypothetical protein